MATLTIEELAQTLQPAQAIAGLGDRKSVV